MRIDRNSLGFKIVVPSFFVVLFVFAILLVVIGRIAGFVQNDYSRYIVTAAGMETEKILSSKASELTSAKIMGNPVVADAMQASAREALAMLWSHSGHHGIIVLPDGSTLSSTLSPLQTRAILDQRVEGFFSLKLDDGHYYCFMESFPLWGWKVVTVIRTTQSLITRSNITLLIPIVAGGCLLMATGILLVLRRKLNPPIMMMVSAIGKGEEVERTGVSELDFIGSKVNSTFQRLGEKTDALNNELQERIRVEKESREKDEHIRLLLDFTAEGIYGVDMHGNCTFCNPSCLRMLGYEREDQLMGANMHELIHHTRADGTPYPEHECKAYSAHRESKMIYEADEVFWRLDGTPFPVEYWAHPVTKDGCVTGTVVTFIDISQRRQLEEQLLQSQKLESIGRLAGGVAHDFNNLLTPIIGYSELLKRDLPEDSPAVVKIGQIMKAADKARILIQQLLSFSRKQILDMKVIDINQVLGSFYGILRCTIRENIEVRLNLASTSCGILADPHQIEQIIMNLVVNAQDAISGNGVVSIETALVELDEEYCLQHKGTVPGHNMMLAVTDDGCGMDKQTISKVFEPFFTTKEVGQGTGLGLATVHGLVKQHGGNIWVYSEPGIGTTFKCFFPVVAEMPVVDQHVAAKPVVFTGKKCNILLVEDNEMARNLAYEILKEHGLSVIVAENPLQALQMIDGVTIDLLITDVVMPGLTGVELNHRLLKIYPDLKTLYMSGYTSNVIVHHGVLADGINFIPKPFTVNDFAKKVEVILNS